MSRYTQTYESDLLHLLLRSPAPDDVPIRSTASSAAAILDCLLAGPVEEEEEAMDPFLHSPLTEDASLVAAMFEREAELCGIDGAAENSAAAGVGLTGASAPVVVQVSEDEEEEEEERPREDKVQVAIKLGDELECHSEDMEIKCGEARREEEKYYTARRTRSAEVHNRCERRRRGRINQRFKTLQELVPRCNDKMMSGGCGITQMMLPAIQTCMIPGAAIGTNSIGQPVPATGSSGDATAGCGGSPAYPSFPYGLWRGPVVTADSSGHQPAAPWPLFPQAFQSMAMASFGQAMGATMGQHYYKVPNASSMTYQDMLQVGSTPVNGYQFLGIH